MLNATNSFCTFEKKIEETEDSMDANFPKTEAEYECLIKARFPNEVNPQELRKGIHYRKWIYIFYKVNCNDSIQLVRLQQVLSTFCLPPSQIV